MPTTAKRMISLPVEQAAYIDSQVAAGAYGSASEVVSAGLQALQERHAAIEHWLHDAVVPAHRAMQDDPKRAIPADQVFAALEDRIAERRRRTP